MNKVKITGSAPVLLVRDVVKSADYYRDKAGFCYERFWGDPPDFCILQRDGFHLMLSQVGDPAYIVPHYKAVEQMWDVYFWVNNASELYEDLKMRGAIIDYDLHEKAYGCLEFGIQDLDGYDIAFGQLVDASGD